MPRLLKSAFLSLRDAVLVAGPFVLLTVLLLVLAYWVLNPTPPKRVVLVTGPDQSAFEAFGKQYKAALAKYGIELLLKPSEGSLANLQLLKDDASEVSFGFVQGGTTSVEESESQGLVSLGSLFYEPVWVFYRQASANALPGQLILPQLSSIKGWRINLGTEGSGTPRLMQRLLSANRMDPAANTFLYLDTTPAVVELLEGRIDALVFASAPESPLIQMLLATPGVSLLDFAQAQAYARRFGFLSHVVLPRGIVELGQDIPAQDYQLIAPTSTLVAREKTHPALMQLMVQAASEIHGPAGWFRKAGEFPNARYTEIPIATEAQRFYKEGPPLLQRYLPFWLANLIERMWVVLISIIAILLPLSRVVPPLYEFRIRSRIFRWYGQLREVEEQLAQANVDKQTLLQTLDLLENRVKHIAVPLSYADELYSLRGHINMVRSRLKS